MREATANILLMSLAVAFLWFFGCIWVYGSHYIPEGTHLSYPGRPGTLVTNLFVEKDNLGGAYFEPGNMDFSQQCSLKLAYSDGTEEIVDFTQIRDGLPVE